MFSFFFLCLFCVVGSILVDFGGIGIELAFISFDVFRRHLIFGSKMEQMANKIYSLVVRFASGKKAIKLFLSMDRRENDSNILKFKVMFFGKFELLETELVKREESLGFDLVLENGCYCSKKREGIIGIVRLVGLLS
jgi:hypothetical protein